MILWAFMLIASIPKPCENPHVTIIDPANEEVVFDYLKDHCSEYDVPDSPAMAFKNKDGKVVLFNGLAGAYPHIGNSLDTVKHDCHHTQPMIENNPDEKAGPEVFYNQVWLRDPWTYDGETIYALVHNEWDLGKVGWFPNIIAAISTNGGKSFKIQRDKKGNSITSIVTPFKYDSRMSKDDFRGMAQQSNIVSVDEKDGKKRFYLFALNAVGKGHKGGSCLFQNEDIKDPNGWRAWDGEKFSTRMNVSRYRDPTIVPKDHICKPVTKHTIMSFTYNEVLHAYLGVGGQQKKGQDGKFVERFVYMTSNNMIDWSEQKSLREVNWLKNYRASKHGEGVVGQAYPALLDPTSKGRNFEFSGAHPYLYYTRMHPKKKGAAWGVRDLVRTRLEVSWKSTPGDVKEK